MTSDEFQSLMADAAYPVLLSTTGGKSYLVRDSSAWWVPSTHPDLVFVAIFGRGVPCIHIDKIESLEPEANGHASRYD